MTEGVAHSENSSTQVSEIPALNIEDFQKYLLFLAGSSEEKEIFTFTLMDSESNGIISNLGLFHDNIFGALETLKLNPQTTLHVRLNRTNLRGGRTSNMVSCRVLVVDLDREVEREEITGIIGNYRPALIVESSNKKYHIYWKLDSCVSLEQWSRWQLGLAHALRGDYKLSQVTHNLRIPGIPRTKHGVWLMPRIVYYNPEHIELSEIPSEWPINIDSQYEAAIEEQKKQAKVRDKLRRSVNKSQGSEGKPTKDLTDKILAENPNLERNSTIFDCLIEFCKESEEAPTLDGLLAQANLLNNSFIKLPKGKLEQSEIVGICKKVVQHNQTYIENLLEYESQKEQKIKDVLDNLNPNHGLDNGKLDNELNSSLDKDAKLLEQGVDKSANVEGGSEALLIKSEVTQKGGYVNGSSEPSEATTLEATEPIDPSEAKSPETGIFPYDFETDDLRVSPFSDFSIVERILQRFKTHIVRTGKLVYAFDLKYRVWRSQKTSRELLQHYTETAMNDAIKDTKRVVKECTVTIGKGGTTEVSEKKMSSLLARFKSTSLAPQIVNFISNSDRLIRKNISMFDNEPYKLLCSNGVVNLLTGKCKPAQATDYMLRNCGVEYRPEATCPYFEKFLSEIYAKNEEPLEMIRFMQEVFGYSLTGSTEERTIFVHVGDGANGKSCLLAALQELMGDYSARLEPGALTSAPNAMQREIARMGAKMEGKRVMVIDDLDTKTQWDDSIVKTVTDKTMVARYLYEEEKDIPNRTKIHIGCNQIPEVRNAGKAMFRRVCIIEYRQTFETDKKDSNKAKEINDKLKEELPGILNWAIRGFLRIQTNEGGSIKRPKEVELRLTEYEEVNAGIEEGIEALFAAPTEDKDCYSVKEILEYVSKCANTKGVRNTLTLERLGRKLKTLGYKGKLGRLPGSDNKVTKYEVKLTAKIDPMDVLVG